MNRITLIILAACLDLLCVGGGLWLMWDGEGFQPGIAGFVLIGIGAIAGGAALMWALRAAR